MVVYWDLLALWNFAADYLLLLCAVRLAGLSPRRGRLASAAALGALYAVVQAALPFSTAALLAALALLCAAAFAGSGQALRLSLLFALLACALAGGVLLLGRLTGSLRRLVRGVVWAELPWGVFLGASALSYLLLSLVFRGGARHGGSERVRVTIARGGRRVKLTLLRDTGNTLTDPRTGEGVPVIGADALRPLFDAETYALLCRGGVPPGFAALPYRAVGTPCGALAAFRCDALHADGRTLGARLIAVSPQRVGDGGGICGLWCAMEEERERSGLETAL